MWKRFPVYDRSSLVEQVISTDLIVSLHDDFEMSRMELGLGVQAVRLPVSVQSLMKYLTDEISYEDIRSEAIKWIDMQIAGIERVNERLTAEGKTNLFPIPSNNLTGLS